MISVPSDNSLVLKRRFDAPIDRVFDAWTKAEILANWFGPSGFTVITSSIELRVGGRYEIILQSPAGELIRHFGEYVEILLHKRLVFTWMLDNQACKGSENQCFDTLVTIEFLYINQFTEIVLTHERLPNKEAYDGHKFGWSSTFDSFEQFITGRK